MGRRTSGLVGLLGCSTKYCRTTGRNPNLYMFVELASVCVLTRTKKKRNTARERDGEKRRKREKKDGNKRKMGIKDI